MREEARMDPTVETQGGVAAGDAPETSSSHTRHGEHVDTIENVDQVFLRQRRLSFSFGAVFFAVTLLVPAFTVWWPWWWSVEIWGGFTANYLFVAILYFVFLWVMAWVYAARADKLDGELAQMDMAELQEREIEEIRATAAKLEGETA
jgi:uncharacterized membrane protein (DUF485 family)